MAALHQLLFFLMLSLCVFPSLQVSVEVLEPKNQGPEVGLIIAPGAHINGEAYAPLAKILQSQSPLRVWVALLDGFINGQVNLLQLNGAVNNAITALKKKGMKEDNVFLAGHSLGGEVVSQYGFQHHSNIKGILLWGAYTQRNTRLRDYPVPVLTITGDLDGLVRITRIEQSFAQLRNDVSHNTSAMIKTPVIILEGINHGQFASGEMPDLVVAYDLDPEVSNMTAYSMIANYTCAFIAANMFMSDPYRNNATKILQSAYVSTLNIMTPLSSMNRISTNQNSESVWTGYAQNSVSNLVDDSKLRTVNKEVPESQLLGSYPQYSVKDGSLNITTITEVAYQLNPLDVSTFYSSPQQLQVELKSTEAIHVLMPDATFHKRNATCKDINQAAVQYAFAESSALAKNRYTKHGRAFKLMDDVVIPSVTIWYLQQLQLNDAKDGLEVTSYSFEVPYSKSHESTTGLFFCKLIDPYRAMEWIYVDSLRKYVGP